MLSALEINHNQSIQPKEMIICENLENESFSFNDTVNFENLDTTRFFGTGRDFLDLTPAFDRVFDDEGTPVRRGNLGVYVSDEHDLNPLVDLSNQLRIGVVVIVVIFLDAILLVYRFTRIFLALSEILFPARRSCRGGSRWSDVQARKFAAFLEARRILQKNQVISALESHRKDPSACYALLDRPAGSSPIAPGVTTPAQLELRSLMCLVKLGSSGFPFRLLTSNLEKASLPSGTWFAYGLQVYLRQVNGSDAFAGVLIVGVLVLVLSCAALRIPSGVCEQSIKNLLMMIDHWTTEAGCTNDFLIRSADHQTDSLGGQYRRLKTAELKHWQDFANFFTAGNNTANNNCN